MAKQKTNIKNNWLKMTNPLVDLTAPDIEMLFTQARLGNDARIQHAWKMMDKYFPVFQSLKNIRLSEILDRKWDVIPFEDLTNDPEALSQAEYIKSIIKRTDSHNIDGFSTLVKTLAGYAFYGRGVVKPYFDKQDNLCFKPVDNLYTAYIDGQLYFKQDFDILDNITLNQIPDSWTKIPESEVLYCVSDCPVGYAALMTYLRDSIGITTWARFIEKKGVPQIVLNAPANTPDSMLDEYTRRAMAIFEGGSGVLPGDTSMQELNGSRGQDPFDNFMQWNLEQLCILMVGGTSLVLPTAAGLGSDLIQRQQEQLEKIVNADCKMIGNAISDNLISKICNHYGLGDVKCKFEFSGKSPSSEKIMEQVKSLKDLGFEIDPEKLRKAIGIDFIKDNVQTTTTTEGETWTPSEDK